MNKRLPIRLAACGVVGAISFGTSTAAHADQQTHRHERGDVSSFDQSAPDPADWIATENNTVPGADILASRARHGQHQVITRIRISHPESANHSLLFVDMRGPRSWSWTVEVKTRPNGHFTWRLLDVGGAPVRCEGATVGTNSTLDTMRIAVPRSCIRSPRWVRVSSTLLTSFHNDPYTQHLDNGFRVGPSNLTKKWSGYTHRLYRG